MLHLDDHTAKLCILSIRLAPGGFSFFIHNEKSKALLLFEQGVSEPYQDTLAQAIRAIGQASLDRLPFKQVNVLLDFSEVTCIPSALYDEDKKDEAFAYNYDVSPREFIVNNHCSAYSLELLFPIPKNVYEYFGAHFKQYRFVHRLSLLLHQANKQSNRAQEQLLIAYEQDHFTAVGLRNHGLIYHNTFTLNCDEDLIYYLLLVFQELRFDQYKAQILIDGPLEKDHPSIGVIKEYVQGVDFMHSTSEFNIQESAIAEQPEHFQTALFEVSQCEL